MPSPYWFLRVLYSDLPWWNSKGALQTLCNDCERTAIYITGSLPTTENGINVMAAGDKVQGKTQIWCFYLLKVECLLLWCILLSISVFPMATKIHSKGKEEYSLCPWPNSKTVAKIYNHKKTKSQLLQIGQQFYRFYTPCGKQKTDCMWMDPYVVVNKTNY